MAERLRTTVGHRRSFERAPRVLANEVVSRDRDDEKNPGWFVGTDRNGVEGYFPSRWFELDSSGANARAKRDYDAGELTVSAGVDVECIANESGWLLVRTDEGQEGWIPASCVE
jgi:flagellar basal body rod protein FlgF